MHIGYKTIFAAALVCVATTANSTSHTTATENAVPSADFVFDVGRYEEAASKSTAARTVWHQDYANGVAAKMHLGQEKIRVDFIPNVTGIPTDLAVWLKRIKDDAGEIRVRETKIQVPPTPSADERYIMEIFGAVVAALLPFLVDAIESWFTPAIAAPAAKYHGLVVVESLAADTVCYKAVEFYRRDSTAWKEIKEISFPLDDDNGDLIDGTKPSDLKTCS